MRDKPIRKIKVGTASDRDALQFENMNNYFWRLGCAALGFTLSLSGCTTVPPFLVPHPNLPPAYEGAAASSLPAAALETWWTLFDDAQLSEVVSRALENGFDARLAAERLNEARIIRGQALSEFRPRGGLQGSVDATHTKNLNQNGWSASQTAALTLPVSWELDLIGRLDATRGMAEADLAAARFNYEATRAALVYHVADALFHARGLATQLDDARASLLIRRSLLQLVNRQVERGLMAPSQADRVAGDVASIESQTIVLHTALATARRTLLVLTGDGLNPLSSIPVTSDVRTAPSIPSAVPANLLARRPDVREALARIESAAGDARLAELDLYPHLTFNPSAGISSQRGLVDIRTGFWTLGIALSVPVLDRERLLGVLDIKSSRGRQAVIAYEQIVQTAFSEADQAITRLAADRNRLAILTEGEKRARRAHDAARIRFTRGLQDLQGVLDAEVAWRATRTELSSTRQELMQHTLQAFMALGGGWPQISTDHQTSLSNS